MNASPTTGIQGRGAPSPEESAALLALAETLACEPHIAGHPSPADRRIEAFLGSYFADAAGETPLRLPPSIALPCYGVARAFAGAFDLPGPILEVGSFQVEAGQPWADLRQLFPGKEYVGLDLRPGPGVDLVGDVEDLPLADGSVGAVLALSTFEHVRRFWRGFEEVRRVLRPGGALLVSCPFNVRIHPHPSDYWRFTPEALDALLGEDYPQRVHGRHGPEERPENVWALAFRPGAPPITAEAFARYLSDPAVPGDDCLNLNVWTPEPGPGARLPVLVLRWLTLLLAHAVDPGSRRRAVTHVPSAPAR